MRSPKNCYVEIMVSERLPKAGFLTLCYNGEQQNGYYNGRYFEDGEGEVHPTHWLEKQSLICLTEEEYKLDLQSDAVRFAEWMSNNVDIDRDKNDGSYYFVHDIRYSEMNFTIKQLYNIYKEENKTPKL